jgi:pimeloyl-ACP methyl ester carboxylesterase
MRITLNGEDIYAATGGKEFNPDLPVVLFIHGSGLDHRSWALQTRWFAYNGFSVLAPDLPGHSLSAGSPLTSIQEMGAWLSDFLSQCGVKQCHVVGHSQGFLCALELAHQSPDKVASLTGIGTASAIPVNPALIDAAKKSAADAAELMLQWGFGQQAQMGISAVPGMQPIAIGRQIMSQNPLAEDLQACADYSSGDDIAGELKIPSLVILADQDRMTPLKAGKALAQALQAETCILNGYGHMLPIEAPKQSLQAMSDFITKQQK